MFIISYSDESYPQHHVWERRWVPNGNLNNLSSGFPFSDHENSDGFTLLFRRERPRNVHSFKALTLNYFCAHWIFATSSLPSPWWFAKGPWWWAKLPEANEENRKMCWWLRQIYSFQNYHSRWLLMFLYQGCYLYTEKETSFLTSWMAIFGLTATSMFEIWTPEWSSATTNCFKRDFFLILTELSFFFEPVFFSSFLPRAFFRSLFLF